MGANVPDTGQGSGGQVKDSGQESERRSLDRLRIRIDGKERRGNGIGKTGSTASVMPTVRAGRSGRRRRAFALFLDHGFYGFHGRKVYALTSFFRDSTVAFRDFL